MNPAEQIREHIIELRDRYRVASLGIFGSFARGEASESSDIDILVEFSESVDLFHFIPAAILFSGDSRTKSGPGYTRCLETLK